ncbi:MAG: cyclic-phosphate processing receiver domain-containing protein [Isosphaeraceae bacterium]
MARCEQGYLCEVCGEEVEEIADSDLYLRYVLGEVDPEQLHRLPERHIRCNPALGQFIVADGFPPLTAEGAFAKSALDPEFVAQEEERVTRGYLRLKQLDRLSLPILEYPLPEVRERWLKRDETSAPASPTARETRAATPEPSPQILFLDDDPARARDFLRRHPEAVWVETAQDCIARLSEEWDQVHLDHDLGGEIYVDSSRPDCGMEVVRWLCAEPRAHVSETLFIIHTLNAEAASAMLTSLCEHGYQAVYRPFGVDLFDWYSEEELDDVLDEGPAEPAAPVQQVSWTERLGRMWRRFQAAVARKGN